MWSLSPKEARILAASWQEQVNHPRLLIYETGRLDSAKLGEGQVNYGKLHAKFYLENDIGFVGTTNFDYRSRVCTGGFSTPATGAAT
jgi:phosphatidylserine/phosphatidylglycerophosphate/cardiolipin synthase-like enzyme